MNIQKKIIGVLFMAFVGAAHAIMPVIDGAALVKLAQELKMLEQQYQQLQQTKTNTLNTVENTKSLMGDATGHYGFGNLDNSVENLKNVREWSPSDWHAALQGLSGGNPTRYQELVETYKKNYPQLDEQTFEKGGSQAGYALYQKGFETNQASQVQATYAFNNINQHLETIQKLSSQIESNQNKDTKSAIDLNSRLLTEIAYLSAQSLKLQALVNEQMAQRQASALSEENQFVQANGLRQ